MKQIVEITLKGKRYPVIFTLGTAYLFCRRKGIEIWQFDKIFYNLDPEKLPTSYFEDLALLIICGIENAAGDEKQKNLPQFEIIDIMNWMSERPAEQEQVMNLLFNASPKPEEQAKKKKKGLLRRS